ncbi:MAG: winged helix-turn-helix transcriptional regulator [Acidimicrobiales bacterium]
MKSYGQYCALARSLDAVGDRWSLLIVRELLHGPARYRQLLGGLPGIATNLLADRLRQLADAGVVEHGEDGRYQLTRWGQDLREPLYALARWAAPVVMRRPLGTDTFRAHWLAHPLAVVFAGHDPARRPMTVELRVDDAVMTLDSADGHVQLRPGEATRPEVTLAGPPDAILGVLTGQLDARNAATLGLDITGDARLLAELRPIATAIPPAVPAATVWASVLP